jgi:hypothetical protein
MGKGQVRSRYGSALRFGALAAGAVAAVVAVTSVAHAFNVRSDLTQQRRNSLPPYAVAALADLKRPVQVTAFLSRDDVKNELRDLLSELESRGKGRLRVEFVDPDAQPGRAAQLEGGFGDIVVQAGPRTERVPGVRFDLVVGTIIDVGRGRPALCLLTGHGEWRIEDEVGAEGLAQLALALADAAFDVEEIQLVTSRSIAYCDGVLSIAPRSDFLPDEVEELTRFVGDGHGFGIMAEPFSVVTSLRPLLSAAGLGLSDEVVQDPVNSLPDDPLALVVGSYPSTNPIVSEIRAASLFLAPRAVTTREPDDAVISTLAATESSARLEGGGTAASVPVGAASQYLGGAGRVVVWGDAHFATNQAASVLGDRQLALNTARWITGRDALIASETRSIYDQVLLTASQRSIILRTTAIFVPGAWLLFGLSIVTARRYRHR